MSVKLMALVWDSFPGAGSELLVMLKFADYGNDAGESIYPSVSTMAAHARLSESQARRVIHSLIEQGWIEVVGNANGGAPGTTREYRIRVDRLHQLTLLTPGADATPSVDATPRTHARDGSHPCARRVAPMTPDPPLTTIEPIKKGKETKYTPVDLAIAEGMYAAILDLNPKHKPPNLDKWANDIRLMRERDGRTREQIVDLFTWANAHPFWKTNILSPATLREKWDRLTIQRDHGGNDEAHQRIDNSAPARVRRAYEEADRKRGRVIDVERTD